MGACIALRGFEPRLAPSKGAVLPLDERALSTGLSPLSMTAFAWLCQINQA